MKVMNWDSGLGKFWKKEFDIHIQVNMIVQEQCQDNWIPGNKTYSHIQPGSNYICWFVNNHYHWLGWLYALVMWKGTYIGSTECPSEGNMDAKTEGSLLGF